MASTKTNVAELVEQMPATDKELEALKAPPPGQTDTPKPKPSSGNRASKFTGPDPAAAAKMADELLGGGRSTLLELVSLVRDPADPEFKNYKAEYAVHCLVILTGAPARENQRKLLAEVLLSQVAKPKASVYLRTFLIRELQWAGDPTALETLGSLLTDETLCAPAASALAAIGGNAADQFRQALPKANGRCRLVVVQSLAALRDPSATEMLRQAATDPDRDVRLAAVWGLAQVGDAASDDLLLKVADAAPSYERVKATQACLLLAENLAKAVRKQEAIKIYTRLRDTRTDPKEQYIRDLAAKALEALASGKIG